MTSPARSLILASSSPYRRELLQRLGFDFESIAPEIDETPRQDESGAALAERLATAKAQAIARVEPEAVVIGSDQVAICGDQILGKPGIPAVAAQQLALCSGNSVRFCTAVSIRCDATGFAEQHLDTTTVRFRSLSEGEIAAYLQRDQPWDCAGSFRSEGLGITLFDAIENRDPSALIGLPLIWVAASLQRAGLSLLI